MVIQTFDHNGQSDRRGDGSPHIGITAFGEIEIVLFRADGSRFGRVSMCVADATILAARLPPLIVAALARK